MNEYPNKVKLSSELLIGTNEDSNINENTNILNYKQTIQILLSELGFIFVLGLIIFFAYIIPENHSKKVFTSKEKTTFEKDPIILLHTTDIHISIKKSERTDGSSIFMMSLCEYNPDLVLLTGDYVDNFDNTQQMGLQNLEEWKIYNTSIRGLFIKKGFKVIEVSGNHDQWAIDEFNSKDNNYLDYSFTFNRNNTKTESDFFVKKI